MRSLPETSEAFGYDADGNLTSNGRFTITWDAENRALSLPASATRPRARKMSKWSAPTIGSAQDTEDRFNLERLGLRCPEHQRFVYDGWNLVATLNSDFTLHNWFMWGLDLSGSPQGAGGVAGLLAIGDSAQGTHFAAFDGNGNVAALVKASDGTIFGAVRVWPLRGSHSLHRADGQGEPVQVEHQIPGRRNGPALLRLSVLQREHGKVAESRSTRGIDHENLYGFVDNDGINFFDLDGLDKGSARGGAAGLMNNPNPAFPGIPINPINGLQLLVGLPFSFLSGDIFFNDTRRFQRMPAMFSSP